MQQKVTDYSVQLSAAEAELALLRTENTRIVEQVNALQADNGMLQTLLGRTETELSLVRKHAETEQTRLQQQQQAEQIARKEESERQLQLLREQVTNITQQLLKQRSEEFAVNNTKNMTDVIEPLNKTIAELKNAAEDAKKEQIRSSASFEQQIRNLMETSQRMSLSADRLSTALTSDSQVQGHWGETVLKSILDAQGLVEGLNYDLQETLRDAHGNPLCNEDSGERMRPDVVVHMDRERDFIIDAKVSLTAFIGYQNAQTDEDRKTYQEAHLKSMRKHVAELAKKDYSKYIQAPRKKLDFVMMFVPHESALQLALYADASLWHDAMRQGVFIVGEQNLYAALRAVELTWTQIRQAENHQQVYELANVLSSRVGDFLKKYQDMGERIRKLQEVYDATEKKLTTGQSVLGAARKLINLGAKEDKNHPLPYTDVPEE
ncbi:MAG: DNA recombination protein RmuC [Paludibacter sp.]|nr:DNA recombination protein RmuC [Paludibacter sp.]